MESIQQRRRPEPNFLVPLVVQNASLCDSKRKGSVNIRFLFSSSSLTVNRNVGTSTLLTSKEKQKVSSSNWTNCGCCCERAGNSDAAFPLLNNDSSESFRTDQIFSQKQQLLHSLYRCLLLKEETTATNGWFSGQNTSPLSPRIIELQSILDQWRHSILKCRHHIFLDKWQQQRRYPCAIVHSFERTTEANIKRTFSTDFTPWQRRFCSKTSNEPKHLDSAGTSPINKISTRPEKLTSSSTNNVNKPENIPTIQSQQEEETTISQFHSQQPSSVLPPPVQPQTAWRQLQSLPNQITLARIASTPLLCYWITHEEWTLAIVGCAVAAFSDGIDGYIARTYGGSTVLGTYLDPLGDKILINSVAFSLWTVDLLPTPLIVIWATRDVLLLSGTAYYLYRQHQSINVLHNSMATQPLTVTPSVLGKLHTVLQFVTIGVALVTPLLESSAITTTTTTSTMMVPPPYLLPSLCWVTGITTVASVLSYASGSGVTLLPKTIPKAFQDDDGDHHNDNNRQRP